MKWILLFVLIGFLSCNNNDEVCIDCGNDLIVLDEQGDCQCKEGYMQLGAFEPRECGRFNSIGLSSSTGNCIRAQEGSYYMISEDCSRCSPLTAYDTMVIDIDHLNGNKPAVYYSDGNVFFSSGMITNRYTDSEGRKVRVLDYVNAAPFDLPDGSRCPGSHTPNYYGSAIFEFTQDNSYCETYIYWYDTFNYDVGETIPIDSCKLILKKDL